MIENLFPICPRFQKNSALHIMSYLPLKERITTICLLSLAWKEVGYDKQFWKSLYKQHFGKRLKPDICFRQFYQIASDALHVANELFNTCPPPFVNPRNLCPLGQEYQNHGIYIKSFEWMKSSWNLDIPIYFKFYPQLCRYSVRFASRANFNQLTNQNMGWNCRWPVLDRFLPKGDVASRIDKRVKLIETLLNGKLTAIIDKCSQNYYNKLVSDIQDFTVHHDIHFRNCETMVMGSHPQGGANVICEIRLHGYKKGECLQYDILSSPSSARETQIIVRAMNHCILKLMENRVFLDR